MLRYNQRERKLLSNKISLLSNNEHTEIFKLLQNNNVSFTKNNNGVFFNLSDVNDNIIQEINNIVNFFYNHKNKINTYLYNINYNYITQDDFNDNINNDYKSDTKNFNVNDNWYNIVFPEQKKNEKIISFLNNINDNFDKNYKKKGNMKFVNAKKRYSRKFNCDKKYESMENNLKEDSY